MPLLAALASALSLFQAPACDTPPYAQFDFWVGEWDVYDKTGKLAGTNSITKAENDCLIIERWTSATGNTGQSYNYYDPGTEAWRQLWVSPGVIIDYAGELEPSGSMVLVGGITYRATPSTIFPFRGTWTPNEDGSVTQFFEQFNPETEKWDEWFTGTYRRQAD